MTLIIELDLDRLKLNHHDKYLQQKVISFDSHCPHTQAHSADRLLYPDLQSGRKN